MKKFTLTNILLFLIFFTGCKKEFSPQSIDEKQLSSNKEVASTSRMAASGCREELQPDWIADTIDVATQLGTALIGSPYSAAIMQQAAINLYGNDQGITANKKHIRYKPSTLDQLELLANSDIELFDYPLDKEVIEEGDYYPQPGIGENEIPWFYSVVDINYQPLSGIQYEELAQLYVPDDDIYLENEAFRITGNPYNDDCDSTQQYSSIQNQNAETQSIQDPCLAQVCPPDYTWDQSICDCVPNTSCPPGYHWDGSSCVLDNPSPPPLPVSKKPSGQILVKNFVNGTFNDVPVRRTRVVLRRRFKIDKVYTDDQGNFYSTKHFNSKVNVFVKFKSTQLTTRGLRGVYAWQALFPIKHGLGKYSGDLRNINWTYTSAQSGNSRANRNWWAAQVMNSYLEFNESATAQGFGILPSDMRILLTSWQGAGGAGSTPMNHHRDVFSIPDAYIQQFFVQPASAWWGQVYNNVYNNNEILSGIDMSFGYNTFNAWASDRVKQLMYHELGHASHFNKVGQSWWNDLIYAESYETARFGVNNVNSPYGTGDDGFLSDYISLGESWAEHIGQTVADRIYGLSSTSVFRQGNTYTNNLIIAGSSHINYLEDFSPFRTYDPFRWIPDGLYYDLIDNRNDQFVPNPRVLINDAVFGFTNQQLFNALESDVKSLPAFRQRLLQQNGNNQANEVIQLLNAYGY